FVLRSTAQLQDQIVQGADVPLVVAFEAFDLQRQLPVLQLLDRDLVRADGVVVELEQVVEPLDDDRQITDLTRPAFAASHSLLPSLRQGPRHAPSIAATLAMSRVPRLHRAPCNALPIPAVDRSGSTPYLATTAPDSELKMN